MEHTFKTFGTMLDCSRNAVMTVDAVRRWIDLTGTQNDSAEAVYNPEKYLLYCDPFMGQLDNRVKPGGAADYADCAARLSRCESDTEYGYLFRSLRALCNFLNIKADLGIRTRAAYLAG